MEAQAFEALFVTHVVASAEPAGFRRWGKGLWFEQRGCRAALLRSETRYDWPFAFTLVVGHDCLRDFDDSLPAPRSPNFSEWPVKLEPSRARELLGRWRYLPWNHGAAPQDVMDDAIVDQQLAAIGSALADAFPDVVQHLTPATVLRQLRRQGRPAWCEERWIADYEAAVAAQ